MSEQTATTTKGRVDVRNFGLSYPTLEGPVEAVIDASIHVDRKSVV